MRTHSIPLHCRRIQTSPAPDVPSAEPPQALSCSVLLVSLEGSLWAESGGIGVGVESRLSLAASLQFRGIEGRLQDSWLPELMHEGPSPLSPLSSAHVCPQSALQDRLKQLATGPSNFTCLVNNAAEREATMVA